MENLTESRRFDLSTSTPIPLRIVIHVVCCALFAFLSGIAVAQSPSSAYLMAANQPPPLARSTFSSEAHPNPEYTLGPGDEIRVTIAGREELTLATIIGPDGRISLPISGTVELQGLTRAQAALAINNSMAPFYISPSATVVVTHYNSNTVLLLGATLHPGVQTFDHPPTLLEVLSRGGIGQTADNLAVGPINTYSTRSQNPAGIPERAFIYRGSNQMAEVDIRKLLDGDSFADLSLQRGDVVLVPVVNDLISVLGAVKSPGALHFAPQTTLSVLLAEAGGLDDKAGANPLVRIVNPSTKTTQEIHFKELLNPDAGKNITLRPGDVIFVPTSEFGKFAYVVEKLSPITTAIAIGLAYVY